MWTQLIVQSQLLAIVINIASAIWNTAVNFWPSDIFVELKLFCESSLLLAK